MISAEAVEAARQVVLPYVDDDHFDLDAVLRAALEAAAPHMFIHVHHHDIEHHARSFNEGYETSVAQGLVDDPSLAQDWLDEKLAEAFDQGQKSGIRHAERLVAAAKIGRPELPGPISPNPYRSKP